MIKTKRVYARFDITDGLTILVDRLWPRGVRKSTPNVEIWMREIAPSDQLRKRFMHDPQKWRIFKRKYLEELKKNDAVEDMLDIARTNDPITLIYATSDEVHNNANVLKAFLEKKLRPRKKR